MARILTKTDDADGTISPAEADRGGCRLDRSQRAGVLIAAALLAGACGLYALWRSGPPVDDRAADGPPIRVNVNEADWPELSLVPGLGAVLSERITDYRTDHGPFASLDELTAVKGIGRITLDQLRPYLVLADPDRGESVSSRR